MAQGRQYKFMEKKEIGDEILDEPFFFPEIFTDVGVIHASEISVVAYFNVDAAVARKQKRETVVIKQLQYLSPKKTRHIFRELAILLNSQGHPHVVNLLGAYSPGQWRHNLRSMKELYLVFETMQLDLEYYYELEESQQRGPTHIAVARIMLQLTDALLFLHKKCHITHRDLKPRNVGIVNAESDTKLVAKLLDFGLSAAYEKRRSFNSKGDGLQPRPPTSKKLGTIGYKSPEFLMGIPIAEPVDVWGLGCILGELMLCKPLFEMTDREMENPRFTQNIKQLRYVLSRLGGADFTAVTRDKIELLDKEDSEAVKGVLMAKLPNLGLGISDAECKLKGDEGTDRTVANCRILVKKMLRPDPERRINLEQLHKVAYFREEKLKFQTKMEEPKNLLYTPADDGEEAKAKSTEHWKDKIREILRKNEREWKWMNGQVPLPN